MTPAPWTLKQHATNHQTLTGATAGLIADIHKDEDARLLAAAPDLLVALQMATHCLAWHEEQHGVGIDAEALRAARAAITKATGEPA